MIRILQCVSNMDRAGIETMLMNFYRHVDRNAVQFDFLANKPQPGAYEDEIKALGGRVFVSPGLHPLKYPKYVAYMRKLLKEHPEINMIHVHNGALGLYALVAARLCGMKNRLYHAHGTRIPAGKARPFKMLCRPFINGNSTCHLACGDAAARFYYGKKTFENHRYALIHNAIELDKFAYHESVREQLRAEYQLDGKIVIGHAGRFSTQKNHARMLKIFAKTLELLPNAVLLLLGEGELMDSIKAQAAQLGIADKVMFMGNVPNMDQWYQAMDAFLLPSIWEGLPVVGVEAQASGLPCFVSSTVTKEMDVSGRVTYIPLEESDERWASLIAQKINAYPARDGMREALRAAGYDITLEAKKLQDIYVRLMKNETIY